MKHKSNLDALELLFVILIILAQILSVAEPAKAADNTTAFKTLWERNDRPVAEGRANRTWTWGPTSFKIIAEPYAESPGGQRSVAYYDKTRMEINNSAGDKNSQWYVTNGLLVREMVSGQMQTGDNSYRPTSPARVAVAGDPTEANPNAPTYASFTALANLSNRATARTSLVTEQIDSSGKVSDNPALEANKVRYAYYDSSLGHNIADVFMNFFKSEGPIYQPNGYQTGQILDWLFACGLPIAEPYWASVKIGGKDSLILVQLFERRVLTYNPANAPQWQVEMGNVGQHYYTWRYSSNPSLVPTPLPVPTVASADAFGLIEQDGDQQVLAIGNSAIKRTLVIGNNGGVYTASLLNRLTNTEYLGSNNTEFRLSFSEELNNSSITDELTSDSVKITGYNWLKQSGAEQLIELDFSGNFRGTPLQGALYYQALGGESFIRKWLTLQPFNGQGWAIVKVVTEDWRLIPELGPLVPTPRHTATFPGGAIDFGQYNSLNTANPGQRFSSADTSRAVGVHRNNSEGFFFFQESLFGQENFNQNSGLLLSNDDFVEPYKGFSSGKSTIGIWRGPPEIGFKRYRDYLYNYYAVVKGKKDPVWFNSWYVYEAGINQSILSGTIDRMAAAGFYDILHIDAGWEGSAPLQPDTEKFPQGLDPLIGKLRAAGLGLGLWINPFSHGYENVTSHAAFRADHPDWTNAEGTRLCPLSGAGDYVRERLLEIARNWPLDELYWDGAEWNPNNCLSNDHRWRTYNEARILTLQYYADLVRDLHALRPNLKVIVWSAPPDIHWLGAVDQIQFSDIAEPPLLQSELVRRQQAYYTSFEQPYAATWGDWYGIQYNRSYGQSLGQPLNLLRYAEVSMLGNNANQAGASLDLANISSGLQGFLKQMFAFRKKFASYFAYYQHLLSFPDGQGLDGEAHLGNGQGFILLFNSTNTEKTINLPLDEVEFEFDAGTGYNLSDWSNLTGGQNLGQFKPGNNPVLTIPAYGYKIIGVNIS